MFLYKLPDETPANRKMAKQIVERWSRPIFDSHRDPRYADPMAMQTVGIYNSYVGSLHSNLPPRTCMLSLQHIRVISVPQPAARLTSACLLHCAHAAMLHQENLLLLTTLDFHTNAPRASRQG